ncbi:MAG: PilC/PilY family type IV pilus protein [Colwellia sp.]|nr:PilC/PilY family type IV pilus protein [Colwellia sp.]
MKNLLLISLVLLSSVSIAEDIELYVGNSTQRVGVKPKVLIIFDNSGSMNTSIQIKAPYEPGETYPAVGGFNSLSSDFVYFTKGVGVDNITPVPDSPSEQRRFLSDINSCDTARQKLASVGFYTGYIREYSFQGNSGSWEEIPDNNGGDIQVIDCLDDILLENNLNAGLEGQGGNITPLPNGYPIDGEGTRQNPDYYTASANNSNTNMGAGEVVTLYTDNYLRWSQASDVDIGTVDESRLIVAKNTITNLIESAPGVDFGLEIFNHNHSGENVRDGGRVVFGIQNMDLDARQRLVDIIQDDVDGETNTPLCESLYEARRYFGGLSVDYGDNDSDRGNSYRGNTPPRDESIETQGTYITPYTSCANDVYVIMITDGVPTVDRAADGYITGLPGITGIFNDNYLPALAGWMHNNDINANLDGKQISTLYTIGFSSGAQAAAPLLTEAATLGGGQYYDAEDPSQLLSSLQSAIINILEVNGSFTSPSVASNNFDRTETLDSVYYAMFLPDRGPRWEGNLKKLKVTGTGLVDRDDASAIASDGNIEPDAKTFWSTGAADGDKVDEGGVAGMLRNKSNRIIYSDIGVGGSMSLLNNAALTGNEQSFADSLGIDLTDVQAYFDWNLGIDVDDEDGDGSTTDIRYDVFGDPLHSKPLVINYGGSVNDQDVRIIVGTNAGFLHMFDDNGATVDETWAFMPKEFFPDIKGLRDNFSSSDKIYGVDGSATTYILDTNGDGSVNNADGDKAWIFVGLRRGGSSYYAIDITVPDAPVLMWHIDSTTPGYAELAQSWSQPKVGYSAINIDGGVPKPVLFIGAGYSTIKDNSGVGADDLTGRGIYMIDAETGTLKWSLTPAAQTATNTHFSGVDSIPSRIAILDSDSDGLTDRLYAGDTGGNVWRVDMPGTSSNSGETPWTVVKLASLGGNIEVTDRRFLSQPIIARATITQTVKTAELDENGLATGEFIIDQFDKPFDTILLGSGDKTNPLETATDDKFFMIKDALITTQSLLGTDIPAVLNIGNLKDYTGNPLQGLPENTADLTSQQLNDLIDASEKSGWYITLNGVGEKSMASGAVVAGVAYFNSFTPASTADVDDCTLLEGAAALYAVDLSLGTTIYDWRRINIGYNPPGDPTFVTVPHIPRIGEPPVDPNAPPQAPDFAIIAPDVIALCDAKQDCSGIRVQTMRTYLYVGE